jgi:hypothetical protein
LNNGLGFSIVAFRGPSDTELAGTPVAFPGFPTDPALDIVADPTDWETAYVVTSTAVYRTYDAGTTWETITGNLTDTQLKSAAIIPGGSAQLLVGGGTGVFALPLPTPGVASAGPYTWSQLGTGLPNARVSELVYDATDDVLVAGTLGRGAWKLDNPLGGPCAFPNEVTVSSTTVSGTRSDTACQTVFLGPSLGASGTVDWTITAGEKIVVRSGSAFHGVTLFRIDPTP